MISQLCLASLLLIAAPPPSGAVPSGVKKVVGRTEHVVARTAPDASAEAYNVLEHGRSYTTVEERNGWLLLACGGWVARDQVVRRSEALDYFSKQLERDPSPFHYCCRGRILFYDDKTREALADLDRALALGGDYAPAFCMRGAVNIDLQRYAEARADLNRALEIEPFLATAYCFRGNLAGYEQRWTEARQDYDSAVANDPHTAHHYLNRARLAFGEADVSPALADIETAVTLDPTFGSAYYYRGLYWERMNDPLRALQDFSEARRLKPEYLAASCGAAGMLYRLGRFDEALAICDQVLARDDACLGALAVRAFALAGQGKYAEALRALELTKKIHPQAYEPLVGTAWIRATCPVSVLRNTETAILCAQEACELTEWKQPMSVGVLAAAYAEAGDFPMAIVYQNKLIALVKGTPQELRAKQRLELYRENKPLRETVLEW